MMHPLALEELPAPHRPAPPMHSPVSTPSRPSQLSSLRDTLPILPQRVLVLEPDPLLQLGLRKALSVYPQLNIVGYYANGCSGIQAVQQLQPDLILLDLDLPQLDWVSALPQIKTLVPHLSILILGRQTTEQEAIALLTQGADGYWVKGGGLKSLPVAIACVQEGAIYLDAHIARSVLKHLRPAPHHKPTLHLSERELQVLQLMVQGCTNPEIASTLYLSLSTVKSHIRNIMNKLAVEDRVQVAVAALRSGLVRA